MISEMPESMRGFDSSGNCVLVSYYFFSHKLGFVVAVYFDPLLPLLLNT